MSENMNLNAMFGAWSDGQSTGVPAGTYTGIFKGIESVPPLPDKDYGPAVKFIFEVTQGEHKGKTPTRITALPKGGPSHKNALGRMILALLGGESPKVGESPNIEALRGKEYLVIVSPAGEGKATRVETVSIMRS